MKAVGAGVLLFVSSVLSACIWNEYYEWRKARLERDQKGAWVLWLAVNGRIARLR